MTFALFSLSFALAMIASILYFLICFSVGSQAAFTEQPRLQTVNGHLFIYGGSDKNISFMTTNKGYINVNEENLYNIVQDAKTASTLVKNLKYTSLTKLEEDMKVIVVSLESYSQRLNVCESFFTSKTKDKNYYPIISLLNARVVKLERRVRTISKNLKRNECRRDPCLNGGTCLDRYLGYECRCPDGWEGKKCEKDVNECAKFAGTDLGCQNGATCYNTKGSYECHCAPGWYGLHCLRRSQDCNSGSATELCGHGICVNQLNSPTGYTCICSQGWKTNGVSLACTVDVDECSTSPCSRNPPVMCHNAPGSFFCGPCPNGYTGNGFQCTDINECLVDNGGCSTEPKVNCINTMGSSVCDPCPPGYSGDGKTCVFVGKCAANNGGCHPNARCIEVGTNVQCQCLPGYTGYGIGPFGCSAVSGPVSSDPCNPNPCKFNGRCYAISATNFTCMCMPGLSGPTCSIINSCENNPCQNGGTCLARGDTFRCKCRARFEGPLCQRMKNECGEYFLQDEGELTYPLKNSSLFNCAWIIRVNLTKVVNIIFDRFELRKSFECQLEWLEIHDGSSSGAPTIGKFCGKTLPNNGTIITSHNVVYFWFRSNDPEDSIFKLTWKAIDPVCGGGVNASIHGVITSPGYPNKYPNNRDCYWEVTAPLGKRIMFTIFELRLNSSSSCMSDFVEIREGFNLDSPLLAKFCNTSAPEIIETPGNTALIFFHTDAKGTDKGFQIAYHPQPGHPGCGGIFTALKGEIVPPTRNNVYLPNMDCVWIIRFPEERQVKIEFVTFSVQYTRSCQDDFLEVRDGGDITAPLLGKFCGTTLPPPITSNHKTMLIRFYTDEIIEHSGFKISYKSVCDETFTTPTGVIKSPGYPNLYKNGEMCNTVIEQPPGKIINLEFQEFEVESTYTCIFDYVEIRDGHDESSPLIGRYCNSNRPGKIISTHNYLHIKMVTDNVVQYAGFYANYSTVDVSCGGIHTAPSGVISSPVEGNRYPANAYCVWVIAVAKGHVIQLTFNKFKIEGFNNCAFDYVAVYDNSTAFEENDGNNLMGRYCSYNRPPLLTSSGNILTIIFSSDSSFSDEGFSASYISVNEISNCGGKYFTEWGVIRTPNYPNAYPNDINCSWVIQVKSGHKINLKVNNFLLEKPWAYGDKKCKFDYLEIRDGGYETSPLIGRYCGTEIPERILSQSNNLYLRFSSDVLDSSTGFEIFWDGSIKGCGGTLTGPKGSIISPNYPEKYGSMINCLYRISISHGSKIRLNFVDLDLKVSKDCAEEYVEVFDGYDIRSKSLGKFCTFFINIPNIVSSGNHLTLRFRSGLGSEGKGFYLKYFTVCHTNLTGYNGIIESPNFPGDYPVPLDCLWSIQAPEGNKIVASFSDFNLKSCHNSYIEVSEGNPSIGIGENAKKYCKNNKTQSVESSKEWIHFRFVTSNRPLGGKFRLEWAVKGCGGYLTKPSGTFTSPNYPDLYPPNIHCKWWITVDPQKSITLVVTDISMEKVDDCVFDGLEVYGGPDETSPLLAKICDMRKDSVVLTSSGNNMYVYFHSDFLTVGKGFQARYHTMPLSCGGLITAHSGSFHSRNYPRNYQMDDCEWHIVVDANNRINLTFVSFDLYETENCTGAYVEVFDGPNTVFPSLKRYCGNKLPEGNLISTGNYLTVRMKVSNVTYTAKGFLANYTMVCGGTVDADSPGEISGDQHRGIPESMYSCSWLISTSRPDGHVMLTLSHMDFHEYDDEGSDTKCSMERLVVYDGPSESSPLAGTYCGKTTPLPIISQGNEVLLKYMTNWTFSPSFKVAYTSASSSCGGNLSSESGIFASPNYPKSYPPNSECVWTIKSAPGNRIQLSFRVFDIGTSEDCNEEYIEIRDNDVQGNLVGAYCGSDPPSNLTAHNALWIKFKSRAGGSGTMRFLADYSLVNGNEINGTSGQIANPGYPNMFSVDDTITWKIMASFKKLILIQFKDLYINSLYPDKCEQSLTIYDGFDDTAPVLFKKCSTGANPPPLTSSSNVVYIVLKTMPSQGASFLLEWSETLSSTAVPITPTSSPIPGCGGEIFLSSSGNNTAVIVAPGNDKYTPRIRCSWKISCSEEEHLSVTLKSYHASAMSYCFNSYVKVLTNLNGNWKELVQFCESRNTNGTFHGHSVLQINYVHDWPPKNSPISLIVRTVCGGSIRKPSGIINFDWRNYSMDAIRIDSQLHRYSCQWDVAVTPGRTIRTTLLNFNGLKAVDGICQKNYFSLRNGGTEDSPYLGAGVYCSVTGIVPRTSSNKLFIKVQALYNFYGFTLKFEEVPHECGGRVSLSDEMNTTVISSPNYPNVPPAFVECIWKFSTSGARRLQIDFIDRFDLTRSQGCKAEYVSVRDGGTDLAEEIGRFCGDKPSTVKSKGNMLYVRYFTNTSDPLNGFTARISLDRCGGFIKSSSGVITSPGYPHSYFYHTNCRWEIETDTASTLKITFEDIDLPLNLSAFSMSGVTLVVPKNLRNLRNLRNFAWRMNSNNNSTNCTSYARITISEPSLRPLKLLQLLFNTPDPTTTLAPLAVVCSNEDVETIRSSKSKVVITFDSGIWSSERHFSTPPRGFKLNFTKDEGCLYNLYTESGVIMLPKRPSGEFGIYNCEWRITVPRGRRITVTGFEFFTFSYSQGGLFVAYNDHESQSRIGSIKAKTGQPESIKSTSNLMTLKFLSPYSSRLYNFKLQYNSDEAAVCGGNVSDSSGYLESPKNLSSFYCPWFFTHPVKENETFSLTVYESVIGNRIGNCNTNFGSFLSFRSEGSTASHHEVFCGNVSYSTIRTPFTKAELKALKSNIQMGDVNFKVKYKISPCGGVLYGSEQVITTPNYPDNYPNDIDCAWLVQVPFDSSVKISFDELRFDSENGCGDYLTVKNGANINSPMIERFCGILVNRNPIISETSSVLIEFHSDKSGSNRGFKIKTEAVDSACGGIVQSQNTIITSPHFPKPYGNNEECEWEIQTKEGMHVVLVFEDRFYIEQSTDCKKDYLKVFDYVDENWKLIKSLCGRAFPAPINSTTNRMKILFHSDSTVNGDGFKAKWLSNCGGTFNTADSGRIVSPGYPGRYPSNLKCEYFISRPGMEIFFDFKSFNLEKDNQGSCIYDSIEFFHRNWDEVYESKGKFCGSTKPSPLSINGEAKIVFTTDSMTNFNGFDLRFTLDLCGGRITEPTVLEYKYGPNNYMSDSCTWTIEAPADKIIVLRFVELSLPASRKCAEGYLKITETNSTGNSVVLGYLCGKLYNNLPVIHSNTNNVSIEANSLYTDDRKKFRIDIFFTYGKEQGCGGTLTLGSNPEILQSPDVNRDGFYEELMDCNWMILAEPFHYITANFLMIDLDDCNSSRSNSPGGNCPCDFVQLRNGLDKDSEILETACGKFPPPTVLSSGNAMSLRFVTDAIASGKGFTIQFSSFLSECGNGFLNVTQGIQTLTSPNYPGKYTPGIRCRWYITDGGSGTKLELKIIHLFVVDYDLEEGDRLTLSTTNGENWKATDESSKTNQTSYVVGKQLYYSGLGLWSNDRTITGKGKSLDYYSASNEVTVDFVSKGKGTKKGFKLEYSIGGCTRNYSSDHGQIVISHNNAKINCDIIVEAPTSNHTISLYFNYIILPYGPKSCLDNYIELLDGPSPDSPLIRKICQSGKPKPVYSTGQYLRMKVFISEDIYIFISMANYVFDVIYTTSDKGRGCGGRVSAMAGNIYSPDYPNNVRKTSKCRWDISVAPGLETILNFIVFDIGSANICDTDFVQIIDVDADGSERVRSKFCGGSDPGQLRIEASGIAVVYSTSVHNSGTGWELEYKMVIPGTEL